MANKVITDEEFDSLSKLVSDPETKGNFSLGQLKQIGALMTAYSEDRQARKQRLIDEGLTEADIHELDIVRESAPEPNVGGIGSRGFTPLQVAGFAEGGKQAVEGILDLSQDLSVFMQLDDDQQRQQWKEGVRQRRLNSRLEHIEEFGQLPPQWSEVAGEIAPWLAALPASAQNFTSLLLKRMLQGGAIGGSTFQVEGELIDRLWTAAVGAGLGGASAGFAVKEGARQAGAKSFVKAFNDASTEQREAVELLVQGMTDDPKFALSLAQVTGSRFIFGLELQSASGATKAAQNTNMDILVNHLLNTSKKLAGEGRSAGSIAKALRTTMKDARKAIYKQATDEFGAGTKYIMDEFGDDVVVSGKEYLRKIDTLVGEQQNKLISVGAEPSQALTKYRNHVDELVNPVVVRQTIARNGKKAQVLFDRRNGTQVPFQGNKAQAEAKSLEINEAFGGIQAGETLDLLKGLNKLIGGDTIIFDNASAGSNRTMGRALYGAFSAELEAPGGNEFAKRAILGLQEQYKAQMAVSQAIDDTTVAAAFGGKKLPREAGKRLDAIFRSESEDLGAVRTFLEEWNPALLEDLRATHLSRIVKGSERPLQPDVDTAQAIQKLAKNLSDNFGRAGKAGKGLHTPAVQADLALTGKALRILANKHFTGITPGGIKVEDIAINVISRSSEFMARFIARAVTSGQGLERTLLNPEFRQAIQRVAKGNLTDRTGKAAMIFLAEWINAGDVVSENRARTQAAAGRLAEAAFSAEN